MKRAVVWILALAFAAPALADVVHLKNGKTLEGKIVERANGKVVVETKFGRTEVKESEVERIEEKLSPKDEFAERRKALAADDVAGLLDLYVWAKGAGLKTEPNAVLRDILKADPEHAEARALLGYVKVDGKWVTEKEAERLQASAERKKMEAQGLVEYKGEWVTPEEKERREHEARGEVLIDGNWVKKADIERAQKDAERKREYEEHKARGEYLVDGQWMPKADAEKHYQSLETPYAAEGDKVRLLTNNGIDFGERMAVVADATYRKCQELFGKEPEGGAPLVVFVAASQQDYNTLGDKVFNADEKSSNFYAFCTPWLPENPIGDMVSCTYAYEKDTADYKATELWVRHATAEQYASRMVGPDSDEQPPRWFLDGVGNYIELWWNPKLFDWAINNRLRPEGGLLKLKTFFKNYPKTTQSILEAGLLIHFLRNPETPEELREQFNACIQAINEGKRIGKSFEALEKTLLKEEDAFYDAAGL